MGEIVLARVDDRLIHGQVVVKWVNVVHADTIIIIDNSLAEDKYMQDVYKLAAPPGINVGVVKVKEFEEDLLGGKFEKNKLMLLFKNITTVKEALEAGIPIKKLNIGGIGKKSGSVSKQVAGSISLDEHDAKTLLELKEKWNLEIFFQVIPDQQSLDLLGVIKKYYPYLLK
jgi:mannose/fructose/N-acetylgalactosamine-specific phosphotransferase system component IIB